MDEQTKEFIKQVYMDALLQYGPEYMIETLKKEGINPEDSEVIAYIKELDEMVGIF
jgi:hypothetical protein